MRVLTRAGWGVLLAGGVALLCGWLFGLPELLILGAGPACSSSSGATTLLTSLRLEVVRSLHPDRVHAGSASRVEVLVRNRGRRRTPVLTLRDGVSAAPPGPSSCWRRSSPAPASGPPTASRPGAAA